MDITILAINDKPGGGLRVLRQLGEGLISNNKKVNYIFSTSSDGNFFTNKKVKYYYPFRMKGKNYFSLYIAILISIIYCRFYFSKSKIIISDPFFLPFVWILLGCKVVRFSQAEDSKLFEMNFQNKSGKFFTVFNLIFKFFEYYGSLFPYDKIFFSSRFLKDNFQKRFSGRRCVKNVSNVIISPKVDQVFFENYNLTNSDSKKVIIGSILRSHPSKRAVDFLTLIKMNKKMNVLYEAICFKDELHSIQALIEENLVADKISIKLAQSDNELKIFYNSINYFVSTSEFDGFGLPPLEAMASGTIPLIARNDGILSYAKDGVNSLVYQSRNVDELSNKLLMVMNDKALQDSLSKNARETALRYSVDSLSKTLESF